MQELILEGTLEENDPIEMEKLIKCTQLIANAIMLSNVLDMSTPSTPSWLLATS